MTENFTFFLSKYIFLENSCSEPKDPINGHKNCSQNEHAVQCTLACDEGFAFAFKPTKDYFCEVRYLSCFVDFSQQTLVQRLLFRKQFEESNQFRSKFNECLVWPAGIWYPENSILLSPGLVCNISIISRLQEPGTLRTLSYPTLTVYTSNIQVNGPGTWYPENSVLPYLDCFISLISRLLAQELGTRRAPSYPTQTVL